MVIAPWKPGIVNVALDAVVGLPPVNATSVYVPAVYPDPDAVMVPSSAVSYTHLTLPTMS